MYSVRLFCERSLKDLLIGTSTRLPSILVGQVEVTRLDSEVKDSLVVADELELGSGELGEEEQLVDAEALWRLFR